MSTIAHYLLAIIEQLERDAKRLESAYRSTNVNPLGACAITGTGFPIDRHRTSALLGFDGPTGNTYGSIAAVDYLLEGVSATATAIVGLGRVVQDLLLWGTMEFGYLLLAEGFVQSSSIMPQKRNPVALEHARGIGSQAVGQAQAIITAVHNTPFGDIVDTEDDLQPLVASMFRDATRMVTHRGRGARGRAVQRGAPGGARRRGRHDDHRAGRHAGARSRPAVRHGPQDRRARHSRPATTTRRRTCRSCSSKASTDVLGTPHRLRRRRPSQHILSPRYFVAIRKTHGGPAPERTDRGHRRVARGPGRRRSLVDGPARCAGRRRRHPARRGRAPVTPMQHQYARVAAVWVVVLAALYAFQEYFTRVACIRDRLGHHRRVIILVWDQSGTALRLIEEVRRARRLPAGQPQPAVVGRRACR